MQTSLSHAPLKKLTSWVATVALVATSALTAAVLSTPTAQAADASYPWSRRAATGDYIADSYDGVNSGHVFENVTTDRLLDILSSNGNYYLAFAGPEHAASQALLPVVNDAAKANGITKIYHFDPYLDGYQLDTTLANGVADVTGGSSTNFGGTAKISDVWKLITQLLPASAVAEGGALHDYAGDTAVLLNVAITDRTNVDTGKSVTALAQVEATDAAAFAADTAGVRTATASALATAFTGRTASVRSEFQFFSRLYNASATKTEGTTATADRIGAPVEVFSAADYPNPDSDFRLKAIDTKELFDLLNSPGEIAVLFAGQGCHNTQAIIGSVAERAKELDVPVVYVVDFALDSNVKFGTGDQLDAALANSATGGLWIRAASGPATTTPYRYGYSYLYGKISEYFGPEWVTENSSKQNNSVPYFPNAVLGETPTGITSWDPAFDPQTQTPNATRLQVPTLVRYNKDAANGPIVGEWLHKDQVADGARQTYTEYMLELGWVRQTALALADTSGAPAGTA